MKSLRFEWDERKNRTNKSKHGVSFEEAVTVFADENALLQRGEAIRIISARKATTSERKNYSQRRKR
ncbi:MAG: BrnT family toxin [Acidobacteriota bacterium]